MTTFRELFNVILTADKEVSRKAAREVRKFLYSVKDAGQYEDIPQMIKNAPEEYAKIAEDFRRENFVMAISVLYFLHNVESLPDFLFPWLYYLLYSPNGNIRYAAVRMFEHEISGLTCHIRCPEKIIFYQGLSLEQTNRILIELFRKLNNLSVALWQPAYKKYKYIYLLPRGSYKSVQMVLACLAEYCGEEYMATMDGKIYSN
ncbi:hypothetical protein HY932_00345 [Candidatus Falkowbacteria bacterium]|nr:hypothetical protein [Candidatus Falkowbacteria bacterium]